MSEHTQLLQPSAKPLEAAIDAIFRQLGVTAGLPDPVPGKMWQRVNPCPCCQEIWSAAVSHTLGYFICYHCRAEAAWGTWRMPVGEDKWVITHPTPHYLTRFRFQVEAAARRADRQMFSMSFEAAHAYAQWRVLVYAAVVPREEVEAAREDWGIVGVSDWDQLAVWEDAAKGDPDTIDQYVSAALNGDLIDYGRHRLSAFYRKERNRRQDAGLPCCRTWADAHPGQALCPQHGEPWFKLRFPAIFPSPDFEAEDGDVLDRFLGEHQERTQIFLGQYQPTPEEAVIDAEDRAVHKRQLAIADKILEDREAFPVTAYYYGDRLSFADIGIKLGCTPGTARARLRRELRRAQKLF